MSKLRREAEKAMFRQVMWENSREIDGTATAERVSLAMEYMMEPGQIFNNPIASVLSEMLGKGPKFHSKADIWEEAWSRLYPQEPESEPEESETESDDTIVLDSSDETIEVDLDSLD